MPGDNEHNVSKIIRFASWILAIIAIALDGGDAVVPVIIILIAGYIIASIFDVRGFKRQEDLNKKIHETFPDRIRKPSWEWEKTGDPELDAWYDKIK